MGRAGRKVPVMSAPTADVVICGAIRPWSHPSSVAVDDFNRAGVADLAVTDYGSDTVSEKERLCLLRSRPGGDRKSVV